MNKASKEMRIWLVVFGLLLWVGIWLTGIEVTHWLLFIPAGALVLAGIFGYCPSQMLVFSLFKSKKN